MDQPLVIYGHHDDLAGGLDLLADTAALVNGFGAVQWTGVGAIAAANFALRTEVDRVAVRPFARRLRVSPPAGARRLTVEAPADGAPPLVGWTLDGGAVRRFGDVVRIDGAACEIALHGAIAVDPSAVGAPRWRPWPKLRRAGTEARDRALPLRPLRAR
jgi:hypothetical protein